MRFTKWVLVAAAALSLCGFASQTRANSIDPVGGSPGVLLKNGSTYTVSMVVTGGNSVITGDKFAVFNVLGSGQTTTTFGALASGWTGSVQQTTTYDNGSGTVASDGNNPLYDVVFTYSGPGITTSGSDVFLGDFSFTSTANLATGTVIGGGSIYNTKASGGTAGFAPTGTDNVNGTSFIVAVPLPQSASMGFALMAGMAAVSLMRKRILA